MTYSPVSLRLSAPLSSEQISHLSVLFPGWLQPQAVPLSPTLPESLVLNQDDVHSPTGQIQKNDIFQIATDQTMEPALMSGKRKSSSDSENASFLPKRFSTNQLLLFPPQPVV